MNSFVGCIIIVGLFSNLTGYFLGYIHRSIHREKRDEIAFKAGFKSAFREWLGFEPSENNLEEAHFAWKNKIVDPNDTYFH